MKTLVLATMLAVGAASVTAYADDTETPKTFVKDSVITTKVKAKLAAKHMSTLANIKVDTDANGVVWLSGKAPSKDAADVAELTAKDTDGVVKVHNKIVIAE